MSIKFSEAISPVKLALFDTVRKTNARRLTVYKDELSCKSGCHSCCYRLVKVTVAEAVILYDTLKKSGKWNDVKLRAKRIQPLMKNSNSVSWFQMRKSCPVLDPETGLCSGYETRPVLCSTHFVKSDPALCDPHELKSGDYKPVNFNDLVENFLETLIESVAGYGILQMELPLPTAILLAERINVRSNLTLEKAIHLFLNEL